MTALLHEALVKDAAQQMEKARAAAVKGQRPAPGPPPVTLTSPPRPPQPKVMSVTELEAQMMSAESQRANFAQQRARPSPKMGLSTTPTLEQRPDLPFGRIRPPIFPAKQEPPRPFDAYGLRAAREAREAASLPSHAEAIAPAAVMQESLEEAEPHDELGAEDEHAELTPSAPAMIFPFTEKHRAARPHHGMLLLLVLRGISSCCKQYPTAGIYFNARDGKEAVLSDLSSAAFLQPFLQPAGRQHVGLMTSSDKELIVRIQLTLARPRKCVHVLGCVPAVPFSP